MSITNSDSSPLEPPRLPKERPGAVGGKRDGNRRRRIRQICDAALGLFLEEGITSTTIDQIVSRAGVAKGSFYRYFRDKTELVETLFAPLATTIREAFDACKRALPGARTAAELNAAYFELARALAVPLQDSPELLRLYLQESRAPGTGARRVVREFADEIAARAEELSAAAGAHGLVKPASPRVVALAVIGAAERLIYGLLDGEDMGAPGEVPALLISVILDGVRTRRA